MKILITGGTGLLGKSLVETCDNRHAILAAYLGDYEMVDSGCVNYAKLDVRNKDGFMRLFKDFKPETVIHAVSVGSPDYAEKNKEQAQSIDLEGAKNILALCEEFESRFVYISSNGVYDGGHPPYSENDIAEPVNYYGRIKLEGEGIAKGANVPFAIVRPILMYGWNHRFERPNIVTIALEKLKNGEPIYAYEDIFCNPVLAQYCASTIWQMVYNDVYDVFNIGGNDTVSIYQLIKTAAEVFGLDLALVRPVREGFFKELVKRPKDTSYDTSKMQKLLGVEPLPVKRGLEMMKAGAGRDYV